MEAHIKILFRFFFTMGMIIASVLPVQADIYRYIDENGVWHFTNVPTSSRYQIYLKSPSASRSYNSYTTKDYDAMIFEASETYGVAFQLVKAVIKVESNFNPRAVSRKGAQGLMQIMPDTARMLSVNDPFDPRENIMGGTRFLRYLLERFNGNLELALAGYNAGPSKVEQYNGIPPYEETQGYVRDVIRYYRMMLADNR